MVDEPGVFRLNNRAVKFFRDERVPDPTKNRRLEIPISEEEDKELSKKYSLWIKVGEPPTHPKLIIRIPSDLEYIPSDGRVDVVVRIQPWSYKNHSGTAAYLKSCVPTEQEQ